ncbi:hypothetical protein [Desulfococcus sp.]|uniref:hypothetical protein n=1 Tax=Desulfococcus sp. TaxID=2025834 RepID=UPI00359311E6
MMSPKVWMMNLVLAVLAVFFSVNAYKIWDEGVDRGRETHIAESDEKSAELDPTEKFVKRMMPSESAYDIVAADNLFSPDRKEVLPDEPAPEAEPLPVLSKDAVSGEAILLYGVVILNDYKKALISNPGKQAGGREQIWVKVGDALSNLKVQEIREDSILLAEGKKTYEVPLYDKNKAKSRKVMAPPSPKAAEKPTVIANDPPKVKAEKPDGAAGKQAKPIEKRMMDNPFRRQFPKQNP